MASITDFGIEVKTKLLKHPIGTQEALAEAVSARTGLSVDGAYISNIIAGRRNAPRPATTAATGPSTESCLM